MPDQLSRRSLLWLPALVPGLKAAVGGSPLKETTSAIRLSDTSGSSTPNGRRSATHPLPRSS